MKTNQNTFVITAVTIAGIVLVTLANASFTANLPLEVVFAASFSLAMIGVAYTDFARNRRPLAVTSRVLRPTLPASVASFAPASAAGRNGSDRIAA